MAQKRMIHTDIWVSDQVAKLSIPARLLFVGIISLGDDDGRLKGSPAFLRSQIFPLDENIKIDDVKKWLNEVIEQKLVIFYVADESEYLFMPKWTKFQTLRADRKKNSNIPSPDGHLTDECQADDGQSAAEGKVSKGKVSKGNIIPFENFWILYPKKNGKKKAKDYWEKLTPENQAKAIADIPLRAEDEKWQGGFIKDPERYIKYEQWNDEINKGKVKVEKIIKPTLKI